MRRLCAVTLALMMGMTDAVQAQNTPTPEVTTILKGHVADACTNGAGDFAGGVYHRDLTGDGLVDLIVDHGGIQCTQGFGRSSFCGAQVCSVIFYVNRGGTLENTQEVLGIVHGISDTPVPLIALSGHGGPVYQWRWDGAEFANIGQ